MCENTYVWNIAYMYVCLFESWLFSIRDIIRLIPTEWMFAYFETCTFGYMFAIMFLCIFKYQIFETNKLFSNAFTYMFACLYVCMLVCLYACMPVCLHVCMHVWLCVCVFVLRLRLFLIINSSISYSVWKFDYLYVCWITLNSI